MGLGLGLGLVVIYLMTVLVASENLQNIHDASRYTLTLWRHRDHSRKPSDVILKDLVRARVRIKVWA